MDTHQPIGIIDFESNAEGNIEDIAKLKFMQYLRYEQKGITILELGSKEDLLNEIGADKIDINALKIIGEKYKVKTIIIGFLDVSDIDPNFNIGIPYIGANAEVTLTLKCNMYETTLGANIWNRSSYIKDKVASLTITDKNVYFNAKDPQRAYGKLIDKLTWHITKDFRSYYKCQ